MQKVERLLNLTAALLHNSRPLTVGQIKERVPGYPDSPTAFRRAFERDKDDLREMGIPLELVEVPGEDPPQPGYLIRRDRYYLPDPALDPDELLALQLAASAVQLHGVSEEEALWKLGTGLPQSSSTAGPLAAIPSEANLEPLFRAITEKASVQFSYGGEVREVQPYRLGFRHGRWYLRGHDLVREAVRVFRVDRIQGEVTTRRPGAFQVPPEEADRGELVPDPWEIGVDEPVRARVRIDRTQASVALAQFGPDAVVETLDDGGIEVELEVRNRDALCSLVLGYLDHAELLSPPDLRGELIERLRATISSPGRP